MSLSLVKTGALVAGTALVLSLASTGAFAKPYAHGEMNDDSDVYKFPSYNSKTVNSVDDGDDVIITDFTKKNGGWFYIMIPGKDGWVPKDDVDVDWKKGGGGGGGGGGVNFCFWGPYGYVCINK